eukprot:scaffold115135_cov63-Phaeocystis_antarctica.AAC.5
MLSRDRRGTPTCLTTSRGGRKPWRDIPPRRVTRLRASLRARSSRQSATRLCRDLPPKRASTGAA